MTLIKAFLYGMIFGLGSPIPGVSAGTMAILLNVYDSFFNSISVDYVKKNMPGVVSFLLGWAVGLLSVSNMVMFLFDYHGQLVSFVFIGLISGCLPLLYKKARKDTLKRKNIFVGLCTLTFMFFLAFYNPEAYASGSDNIIWIFFASLISSASMLIPGVGGSLMMIVFGIYEAYIEAVATLDLFMIAVFGISMVLGVLVGIVITKKMIDYFSQTLYFAILGFVGGSLLILWPGFSLDWLGIFSVILACLGFALAYYLSMKEEI